MLPPYHDPDFTVPASVLKFAIRNSQPAIKRLGSLLVAVFCVAVMSGGASAQTSGDYRSAATGNWNDTATWETFNGASWVAAVATPTSANGVITIRSPHTVTVTAAVTVDQVVVDSGGQVTVNSGIGWTIANGASTDLTINGTVLNSGLTLFSAAGPSWAVNSGGTYIHNTTAGIATPLGGATLDAASNFIYRGSSTLTPALSTSGRTYGNLSFESTSGSYSLTPNGSGTLTINGDFTIGSGVTITTTQTGVMTFAGNFTNNGILTNSTGTQIYTFTGSGKTISGSGAISFEAFNVNNGASTTINGNVTEASTFTGTVAGTLTVGSSGTLITAGTVTNNGTLNVNGTLQINSGGSLTGTAPTYGSSSTLKYNSGGTFGRGVEWSATSAAGFPNDVQISNNTTLDLGNGGASTARAIARDLTIDSGSTLTMAATAMTAALTVPRNVLNNGTLTLSTSSGGDMNVAGNWTNNGTFTPNSRTVTFNGSSQTLSGNSTFKNLAINTSGSPNTVTAAGSTLAVTGLLHVITGTFTSATQYTDVTIDSGATLSLTGDISVSGTWTNNGTVNANGFTVTFNGTTNQSIAGSQPTSFAGLNISNTAGVTLSVNTTVTGTLTLTGDITTGSFTVLMGNGATSAGTGDVVGNVNRGDVTNGNLRTFGNPNVEITNTAATGGDITVNLVKGSAPNDFTNAVKRIYTITVNGGTSVAATLRLRYIDPSELNGNDETTLQLWRKISSSSTWLSQGSTSRSTTDNWVELAATAGLSGLTFASSQWTLFSGITPTAVDAVLLKATRYDKRVLLEWQTGYEVNNVGFNLYREKNGSLERITPEPVAGSALIAGPGVVLRNGFAYSWWDDATAACGSKAADCQNVRYWVEDISINSGTTLHGPFGVEQAPPDQAPPPGKGRVSLLSALGRDASTRGSSAPVERKATVIKPTTALLTAQAALAGQTAVKLSVQHEGWYRVELADLRAAGFPAGLDPNMIQLFADGQQVPIIVTTGDPKPSWTGIEFYGIGIDSAFTANHVYWLVAGSQQGARITSVAVDNGAPAASTFTYTVERRDKVVYFPALKNGGGEKFFGPLIFNAQPADQSVVAQHIAATGGNATLEVSVQGFTATPHSVRVLFNGTELGTLQFDGLSKGTAQYSIAQGSLKEGSNQVQLISPAGFSDISMSEYARLTYVHTNDADNDSLRLPASGGQQVSINGFTDPNVRLIDVTVPSLPQELAVTSTITGTGFSITANVPGSGTRTLLAFAPAQQQKPALIAANQPSNWRDPNQAGDYLVFTRKDLIDSLGPLVSHRHDQGLTPAVVDVEDVYDEFSFGNKSPQALKDFIAYAKSNWVKTPRFVVLAGDATYDPKNYTGVGDNDLVPTRLVETAFNETATDDWFVDANDDGLPDIPVGRLPVRTPDEAAALVSKIVGYDDTNRIKSVLLVADANSGFDFEAADTQLQSVIPKKISVTDIRRGQLGDADARSLLLDAINQGQRLVNYYGHGSVLIWSSAPLLRASDAAGFVNQSHLSLFVAMTCLSGFFQDVSIDSMGESLLKAPAGAIAVWASSGLTDPNSQVVMNQWAIKQLLGPLGTKSTIGEHVMRAKAVVSDPDVRRTWILLGDPATRLK